MALREPAVRRAKLLSSGPHPLISMADARATTRRGEEGDLCAHGPVSEKRQKTPTADVAARNAFGPIAKTHVANLEAKNMAPVTVV